MNKNKEKRVQDYISEHYSSDKPRKDVRLAVERRFNLLTEPPSELAEIFRCSSRTIRRDKKRLRKQLAEDLEQDYSIAGETFAQYKTTLYQIDQAIEEGDYKKVSALKKRWSVVRSFADFSLPVKIERVTSLLERADDGAFEVDLNGD